MAVTQQQEIFDAEESERFAVLWAGFDVCNSSDAEAKNKGNALRRMMAGKKFDDGAAVRLVDAFGLREIMAALDAQMLPRRQQVEDVAVLKEQLENVQEQLSDALSNNQTLTDALTREQELTASLQGRPQQNGSIAGPFLSGVLALALAAECVLAVVGLFGGHQSPPHVSEAASIAAAAPLRASAILPNIKPDADTRPKAKPKPRVVEEKALTPREAALTSDSTRRKAGRPNLDTLRAFRTVVPVVVTPESQF
jgi:hypothetical protein